ncbi:class I SAM-dependent DNA methyltransferase [Nocardioides mangrovicus]|uniref:class I SAM-dependent DNA methyltransferase n=1 Tax=Nocardioides mangrovicus TaxID=2478913 RepID=UPI001E5805CC|nr:class I SAM-dependent methyltransferase [Nocardioides mangrovicus]
MPHNYFDEPVAADYDDDTDVRFSAEHLALESGFLAELASPGGRALELAIGTGRVALPLAARGVEVHGIELSQAMVDRLREKPGGREIPVTLGDYTSADADGTFDVAYLVFNTIGNVTTQDAQVATFANAARHLRPGGCFVVETSVPGVSRIAPQERFRVFDHSSEHVGYDEYDRVTQAMWSHHLTFGPEGTVRRNSVPFRYAWPAELDLMARLAGMRLRERWAWWDRTPFTDTSTSHVSVWEKSRD